MTATGETASKFAMNADAIPTKTFTFKADVASSEGANNVELVRLYNSACPYKTPPQEEDARVRQGIDGFPIVIFWNNTSTNSTTFVGKYNFNNDKSTEEVFGFESGDESWEIKNNTGSRVLWQSADYSGTDWLNDFEARYPDTDPAYTDSTALAALAAWLVTTDQSAATGNALVSSYTDVDGVVHTVDNAAYRLAKFKTEISDHMELQSALFYYLFTELFLMVDSRAKNAFPSFLGGDKWCWLPYDMDTAIGINNEGALVFDYSLEDTDTTSGGADVFNGQQSVMWINLRQAFAPEIKAMYQSLRSTGALSYALVESAFEAHQAKWPEAIFNEDSWFKYIDPLVEDGTDYLDMAQGSKAEQRKWWLYNRFRYIDSKYNAGDALTDVITLRAYARGDITVTPYADIYPSIKYGSYLVSERGHRNIATLLPMPAGLTTLNDTEVYIYSASQLASIGDISALKVGLVDLSNATKLQYLKCGDSSASYSNGNMYSLTLGNNTLLQTIDARNCTGLGDTTQEGHSQTAVDISGCTNIEHVYFDGTNIRSLTLPVGGILKTLHLPSTITNLTVRNQAAITDFSMPSYANITTLRVENSSSAIPVLAILAAMPANSRVRIIGFTMSVSTTDDVEDFFDYLDTMRGLDENGNNLDTAVVSGTLTGLDSVTGAWLAEMNARYPNVTITYNHITSNLYYYNYDGTELLYTESITDGGNGAYAGQPSRASTAANTYTFAGWSRYTNQTTADATATQNVTADRSVYAAYTVTGRTYTVRFYNGTTLLQTVNDVPYGGTATYTGETPTSSTEGFEFTGWSPSNTNILGDTDCYAVFRDTRSPLMQYLARTMTAYESDTATTVAQYAFYQQTTLETVETSATTIEQYAFNECTALTEVDLTNTSPVTIAASAFYGSSQLAHLIIRSTALSTLSNVSALTRTKIAAGNGAIYVPADLVDTYKAATNWSTYASQIYPITAYPVTDFSTISDSWADIIANSNYATDYSIGDTKLLDLGTKGQVYMELVALDTDDKADSSGKARMTWISKSIIETHSMNSAQKTVDGETAYTAGGWENTDMRTYLKGTLKPLIPEAVRNAIVEVTKVSSVYTGGALVVDGQTTTDDVWIPSSHEIYGTTTYETTGPVYTTKFSSNANRIKYNSAGSANSWWLRSACNEASFRYVNNSGSENNNSADIGRGVVLGFCI